ncbi:MAG: ribonuclease PH [Victivallales bacterium]|nr:ribonuclease PH [Victivallales bacterium]
MARIDGRTPEQFRKVNFTKNFLSHPASSVLIEFGGTKVICSVTVQPGVPGWMRAQNVPGGWVTSEYGMLPASTHERMQREASKGKQSGRTMEIQRLIGRSFRSVIDLEALGANTVYIDCDVIDADGGTRCASITGASVALQLAFKKAWLAKKFGGKNPMKENVAAISVGIVNGEPVLDLCYAEDSKAEVDMNVVMTESGKFIEVQGTAEEQPFTPEQLNQMLDLAKNGLNKIFELQNRIISGAPRRHNDNDDKNNGKGRNTRPGKPGGGLGSMGDILGDITI